MPKSKADCSCGSGKRFKHCCGSFGADALATEISKRAQRINKTLFIPKELQVGGLHLGAFLFRDMFCQLYAPIAYGTMRIDFWKLLDLTDFQKSWLAENPEQLAMFTDQSMDVLDFGFGWGEFGHGRSVNARGKDLIWLGTELSLKAGLAAHGMTDKELSKRTLGHNLSALAEELSKFEPGFDHKRVDRVVARFPDYIESRYNQPTPGRIETGHILMGAQYVASEVTRQFTDRNCRQNGGSLSSRMYPP